MLFAIICTDKSDATALRLATRPAHLAFLKDEPRIRIAGPFLDETDKMIGSMMVIEASGLEQAEEFATRDPYRQAGLFEAVDVRAWRQTAGASSI